jgi:type IV pilus assembly protein PilE
MEAPLVRPSAIGQSASAPRAAGFTLIELMIVVAVVAILASVAYPSYAAYLLRSNRAAAQSVLSDLAIRQQQLFLDTRSYGASIAALRSSVHSDVAAKYDVTVLAVEEPPPGFTLSAVPRAGQAADPCGVLSINAAGVKLPATCW